MTQDSGHVLNVGFEVRAWPSFHMGSNDGRPMVRAVEVGGDPTSSRWQDGGPAASRV